MRDKSRKPVLRGKIYCAPFCGAKCTKAAFDKATKEAKALAKQLGKGWKPCVWENMGWHWAVVNESKSMKLYKDLDYVGYSAWLEPEKHLGIGFQWIRNGKTPEQAVLNVITEFRNFTKRVNKTLSILE